MVTLYEGGSYDVIVVGAGHAGCEAALAAARMGKHTLLLTLNLDGIALMACNPAIGGTAKGHLVREVDALGGQMALTIDATYIQIKTLNTGKGPAVHSLRAQADKKAYQAHMKQVLENTENLEVRQGEIVALEEKHGRISAVVTACGARLTAGAVVLCTGVYLKGRCITGEYSVESGPSGLMGANHLSASLRELGISLMRFKTGTPARIDKRSIDFSKTVPEYGDDSLPFSFLSGRIEREQIPCHLTYTNERTHEIIRQNLHRSPLFSGQIHGIGPRYCPSIEDKVVKFPDKERHQLFLEPEGVNTNEIYVQGMSSSLPEEVQIALYRTVPGLENCRFMRAAYAIEYDCIDPLQLTQGEMLKHIEGLFTAGQINGSSGYEEAAAQGIVAGINAVQYLKGEPPVVLGRDQAYTGVLIDDLVTKGTKEPYRMMTSRAEYRLLLRQDNADERLTQIGREVGLVSDARYDRYMYKMEAVRREEERLGKIFLSPAAVNPLLEEKNTAPAKSGISAADLLKRPEIVYGDLQKLTELPDYDEDIVGQLQTKIKYAGYIEKQLRQVEQFRAMEQKLLPADVDYSEIAGIRLEARAKLNTVRPTNVGQASRISGVSPSDIAVLMVYLEKRSREEAEK